MHRFPIDAYRFYPDAGLGFLSVLRTEKSEANLVESFISKQDKDVWNDFVAIFSMNQFASDARIYPKCHYSNLWLNGEFVESTFLESPEDFEICRVESHIQLNSEIEFMRKSLSWRITSPLRKFKTILRNLVVFLK